MADLLDIRYQPWNGSSTATITLPALTGFKGQSWFVHNRGTANVIVAAAGSDNIFTNQTGTQDYIPPGSWALFVNDGTYWVVLNGMNGGQTTQEQFITLTAAYTLANQTAAQKLFNAPTGGALTLLVGTYFFECCFALSGLNAASHSVGFALGGTAVYTRQAWWCDAVLPTTSQATPNTVQRTFNTAANTTLVTAGTVTNFSAVIRGKFVIGTAGTVIPSVSQLTNAAAAVVGVDSYFRCQLAGLGAVQSIGIWS